MEPLIIEKVQAAKGNSMAADALIREYLPFIKSETSKVTGQSVNGSYEDELSIAMIGFHEAIESYSKIRGAFLKYASVVMRRKIIDYYRKEKRHMGQVSLDTPVSEGESDTLITRLEEPKNVYEEIEMRDATAAEIRELAEQMKGFDLSLSDISDNCPKQARTLEACQRVIGYMRENPLLIRQTIADGRLPIKLLAEKAEVEKKTIERHRKYIMALVIIYSNGYEIIRGHLKQMNRLGKGAE